MLDIEEVTENIVVDLLQPRHQVETKGLPEYVGLRNRMFQLIQEVKSHAVIG